MAGVMKLACLVLACMIVAGPITANADDSCDFTSLSPCIDYTFSGGQITPDCCNGVRNYNSMARTTSDRQQACTCLKTVATNLGPSAQLDRLAGIPKACGVDIGYKISSTTDCSTIP